MVMSRPRQTSENVPHWKLCDLLILTRKLRLRRDLSAAHHPDELPRVFGRATIQVVVEIGVDVQAVPETFPDVIGPGLQLSRGIVVGGTPFQTMEPKVNKVGRDTLVDGHDEGTYRNIRRPVFLEDRENFVVQPGRMAKLDGIAMAT